jgi:hypothetical protein
MAVAYYTGGSSSSNSSEISTNGTSHLMYALAHTLCHRRNTCRGNKAAVNRAIMGHFVTGQQHLRMGKCHVAQQEQTFIVVKMTIPLVQSLLHYAFPTQLQQEAPNSTRGHPNHHIHKQLYEEHEAKASLFGLTLLPLIHDCNEQDAKILYESVVTIGSTHNRDFQTILASKDVDGYYGTIKAALERNYECLGISCKDVGGVWDPSTKAYHKGAEPCDDSTAAGVDSDTEGSAFRDPIEGRDHMEGERGKVGLALTLLVGGIMFILVTAVLANRISTCHEIDTSTIAETEQFYDVDLGPALQDDGALRELS